MRNSKRRFMIVAFICGISFSFGMLTQGYAADPYPASSVIKDILFDWSTERELAPGSDNWPITWADDGHQYTSWGDGGGFGGTNNDGRVSLGVARVGGDFSTYWTKNVWGGKNCENTATFGGKSYGILALNGTEMYMWLRQASQAGKSGHAWLAKSTNNGASWSLASWGFPTSQSFNTPTFCQFGKNYAGAPDDFVYSYFIRTPSDGDFGFTITKPGKIDLARVPKNQIMDKNAYEFFSGTPNNPSWTTDQSQRVPVFENEHGTSWVLSVTYNAGLERYILSVEDTKFTNGRESGNVMGFYDAPNPWGPWTTIKRIADFPAWTCAFSNKWTSSDGTESVAILTPADTWKTVAVTFVRENSDNTPPSAPLNLSLSAVSETAIELSWDAARDNESGVGKYIIYRNGSKVGEATTTGYRDDGLSEATTYRYRVSAVNGAGIEGAKCDEVSHETNEDTNPPTIASVLASGLDTQVRVVFSEKVDESSAQSVENYSIDNDVTVSRAQRGTDEKTVTLRVTPLVEGKTYTVTVRNVKDQSNAGNVIADNTTETFVYTAAVVISNLTAASGSAYELDQLETGKKVYIDRDYYFTTIAAELEGLTYIRTANDDKQAGNNPEVTFTVNLPITVYIGIDSRSSEPPVWMSGFSKTNSALVSSDATFDVYEKDFAAGEVLLGPNNASSMYTIIIKGEQGAVVAQQFAATPPARASFSMRYCSRALVIHSARATNGRVRVLDLAGRCIAEENLVNGSTATMRLPAHGVSLVVIEYDGGTRSVHPLVGIPRP